MALQNTRGPRAETDAVWARTLEIAEQLGDAEYRMRALWGLYACRNQLGSGHVGLALARQLADIAATLPESDLRAIADRMIGTSLRYIGDQPAARRHLEQMLAGCPGGPIRAGRDRVPDPVPVVRRESSFIAGTTLMVDAGKSVI